MQSPHRRKKQPEQVRRSLLDCAAQIAVEQGLASVTIQAVAEAAGVTKGGLFHHFASKRNPLFIGLLAIAEPDGVAKLEAAARSSMLECQELLKGIEHVPSV